MGFYIKDEAESLDQVDVQQNTAFHKKVEGFKESLRENTLWSVQSRTTFIKWINGESLPGQPIKTDFPNDIYTEGFRSLFTASGKLNHDEGIAITREDYKSDYILFGFDVSPSICNGGRILNQSDEEL